MEKKIKIPTKEEKRINSLEVENAELWFESLMLNDKVTRTEQEIADLWFHNIAGGGQ